MGTKTQKLSNVVDQIVEWQSVFTGDGSTGLTAVAGRGYFIDTTSSTVTVTLPASPKIGDTISIADYAGTFATNNVTINANGGKIQNSTTNGVLADNNVSVSFVYMDSTKGWKQISLDTSTAVNTPVYISATGGTVTTSGDFKVHSFTGDGCFVVSCAGNAAGSNTVDYLVVAGGGSGGNGCGGGGAGAGGFRVSNSYSLPAPTTSPLANPTGITVTAITYPVTVGGGGAATTGGPSTPATAGNAGSPSVFSTITSAGGGLGARGRPEGDGAPNVGGNGGSGGGGGHNGGSGGSGNTPPVSPSQGNSGAVSVPFGDDRGGGGGGAGGAAATPSPSQIQNGGIGSFISPSFAVGCAGTTGPVCGVRYFAGGGGGGQRNGPGSTPPAGAGGAGGGGNGGRCGSASNATANTGGGGGGSASPDAPTTSGAGGKGIVIIRYKFQ